MVMHGNLEPVPRRADISTRSPLLALSFSHGLRFPPLRAVGRLLAVFSSLSILKPLSASQLELDEWNQCPTTQTRLALQVTWATWI